MASPKPEKIKLMSRAQVAERWNCSEDTVKRSGMPFTRIGKSPMYHPKIVERYELSRSSRPSLWKEWTAA
jgi:hypothetical protein